MRDAEPTAHERAFFAALVAQVPDLQDYYHEDNDGTPWMIVSYDFIHRNYIQATLRLDYDGRSLRGGWSPSYLNWDDGVRADAVPIDTTGSDGLRLDSVDPTTDATATTTWFQVHIDRWRPSRAGVPQ